MTHAGAPGNRNVNLDVVRAIARLRADHVLTPGQAALFDRVARGGLVSVRFEIRALLYAGVLLLTWGVGTLVVLHQEDIGPLAIAAGISLGAAACLLWVGRRAAPFSWGEVSSPNVAFDYVLLLGLLLLASALAYVEAQFTVLGPRWAYHLLLVGVIYLLAAYRWDSRTALALALATLAAWRGLSIGPVPAALAAGVAAELRTSAVVLGALYVGAAALSARLARKAHFEEVFASAGLLLLLGGLVAGVLDDHPAWGTWLLALLLVAGGVMAVAFRLGRSLYFAAGLVATYIGLVRLLFEPFRYGWHADSIPLLLAGLLGAGGLALIVWAHRRMHDR
jgi:hypothetical protein